MSSAQGLVGREAELALTAAAVRQLSEGRASALVIEGEAGIGKTRLVQSILDDARARDVAVFCGTCRRQRWSCCRSRRCSAMPSRFVMSPLSPAGAGRGRWAARRRVRRSASGRG